MASVCVILLALSGFQQLAAVPPASTVRVGVGENVTLRCPLLDDLSATASTPPSVISWYSKAAGQGPRMLLTLMTSDRLRVKYGDGVRADKMSAAADGSLLLLGSEERDSAVYYCGRSRGAGREKLWAFRD
ncbi:secreted immunoglobulin domain 1 [Odontesthes bonariensis]|uniref:secreted immunoglobulin domain 1 n=1 Tax=Odontesthes bonariensis TaxID=219752 RepID=UPI003F58AB7D